MKFITVEIKSWNKYNPRKDYVRPWWFALSNTVTQDPMFSEFSDAEFRAWIHILCMASQANANGVVTLYFKHVEQSAGIKSKVLAATISKLEILKVIQPPAGICTDGERDLYHTEHNITVHNKTEHSKHGRENTPVQTTVKTSDDLILIVPEKIRETWPTLYPSPEYVSREAIKAVTWCDANPKKRPSSAKGWVRFFVGWLERGWDRHRQSIQTNTSGTKVTKQELENIFKKAAGDE